MRANVGVKALAANAAQKCHSFSPACKRGLTGRLIHDPIGHRVSYSSVLGMNSRGLPESRGQTFEETGVFAKGFGLLGLFGVRASFDVRVVAVGSVHLRPVSPCLPQYLRKVSYVAGKGGEAPRYVSQTRYIV